MLLDEDVVAPVDGVVVAAAAGVEVVTIVVVACA